MADWKTSTSLVGGQFDGLLLPSTEAPVLTAAAGTSLKVSTFVLNNQGSATHVWVSKVKSGGTAGSANRVLTNYPLAAGAVLDLTGPTGFAVLNEGDFISAKVDASSTVSLTMDGFTNSSTSGAVLSGIQEDSIGTTGSTSSIIIGTGANRLLLAPVKVIVTGGFLSYASYDNCALSCTDGAMTKLVSVNFDYGSGGTGSVHWFGRANPTSGSTQVLTPNMTKSGFTLTPMVGSIALSGASPTTANATTVGPTTSTTLALTGTSAVGHRGFFAGGFFTPPEGLARTGGVARVKIFNGAFSATAQPNWLVVADSLGASSLPFVDTNNSYHAGAYIDVLPA